MVTQTASGMTEFRTYMPYAGRVRVAGEFTQWAGAAIPMLHQGDGWWRVLVELPAGEHDFNYLVDESRWVADFSTSGVEHNRHGVWVSRVYVPGTAEVRLAS